jgi:hypothetical protein
MESLDIENNPQKKEVWLRRQQALSARQLQLDELLLSRQGELEMAAEANQETTPDQDPATSLAGPRDAAS